jgi:hypothetical protein
LLNAESSPRCGAMKYNGDVSVLPEQLLECYCRSSLVRQPKRRRGLASLHFGLLSILLPVLSGGDCSG